MSDFLQVFQTRFELFTIKCDFIIFQLDSVPVLLRSTQTSLLKLFTTLFFAYIVDVARWPILFMWSTLFRKSTAIVAELPWLLANWKMCSFGFPFLYVFSYALLLYTNCLRTSFMHHDGKMWQLIDFFCNNTKIFHVIPGSSLTKKALKVLLWVHACFRARIANENRMIFLRYWRCEQKVFLVCRKPPRVVCVPRFSLQ